MLRVIKRLRAIYRKSPVLLFNKDSKLILMSDCHRGQGNTGDNFLQNQAVYFGALEHYYKEGFTYIELGDGDELWENRSMGPIIDAHSDVFWLLSRFYRENRFRMLYGNHDIVKSRRWFTERHCKQYYCDASSCRMPLFPGISITEGLILENTEDHQRLLLTHGHQADFLNDVLWRLARFLVRYLWKPLELIGFTAPTGAGRPRKKRDKIEKKLMHYANREKQILIAGHTHRPVFPTPGTGYYFNDGSCVHPRCITGIEIENNAISLVKWSVSTREDQSLYVERQVLEGPVKLSEYRTAIKRAGPAAKQVVQKRC